MLEYSPWSSKTYNECLDNYLNGSFSILDIELGGQCNYHCIYCDSPNREKTCSVSLTKVEQLFDSHPIKWVFICGLGEPTASGNLRVLLEILRLCKKYNAKCSIFTNLSVLNEELEDYLKSGTLNILFKYDSDDFVKSMKLYGASSVNKHFFNVDRVKRCVQIEDGSTNIAASIVPTSINKDEIVSVVKNCLGCNFYPLIAELEDSGDAHDYYSQLALSSEDLLSVKTEVNELIGEEYIVPFCPAVISGIHIRFDGKVTVDEKTGLSCHWFWLQEPKTHIIGDFNEDGISEIIKKIEQYRKERFDFITKVLENETHSVFGGCGGDAIALLNDYAEVFRRRYDL